MVIGFISIIVMVAALEIIFLDYMQRNNRDRDENIFELLASQRCQ
ncbi:MAG: hypothetical protein P4L49_15405 [Desulfosporosinus sp.]|nr:hypothetical protein [Desulfosporosinus sp.]